MYMFFHRGVQIHVDGASGVQVLGEHSICENVTFKSDFLKADSISRLIECSSTLGRKIAF